MPLNLNRIKVKTKKSTCTNALSSFESNAYKDMINLKLYGLYINEIFINKNRKYRKIIRLIYMIQIVFNILMKNVKEKN
jgi:ribosomal protein L22